MENRSLALFLQPIANRPALAACLSLLAVLGCASDPMPFALIIPIWIILLHNLTPFARRATLFICVAGLLSWKLQSNAPLPVPTQPPSEGKAWIIDVQPRAEGSALIASTAIGKVRWSWKGSPQPLPGDSVYWQSRWYPTQAPTVPGSFDAQEWQRSLQLVATGTLQSLKITGKRFHWQRLCAQIRAGLRHRLERAFAEPECALLMGLLAGDRSGISETLQSDFQRTGLVHVLAISGFHVVMLAGMLTLLLRSLRLPHHAVRIAAMTLLCLYAPITGGSAAVWRAVFMFLVIESGPLCERKADTFNSLGVAVIALLLKDPSQLTQAGFQLSVAATAGILLGQHLPWKPASKRRKGWKAWIHQLLVEPSWVTLCATLATLPLLVHHFQSFSPIAWLGNLVVVPLVGFGMEAGVLSLLMPDVAWLFQPFGDSATLLLRLGGAATSALASSPGASATLGPWTLPCLIACAFLIASLPALHSDNPWGRRIALSALLVCAGTYLESGLRPWITPSWSATLLDVGQGDCILLQSPAGRHYLVDTGPPQKKRGIAQDRIIPLLRSRGISRLDALIITHPDADHYGGAFDLLRLFPVRELWTTPCARLEQKPEWEKVLGKASQAGIVIRDLHRGLQASERRRGPFPVEWKLSILHPDTLACAPDVNTGSIVMRAEGLGGSLLLTGDLTREGEDGLRGLDLRGQVLKLGHHGSKTSSSLEFLRKVQPRLAWISAGKGNRYRHPHPSILRRLDSLHIPYASTLSQGSLEMRFTGDETAFWSYPGSWTEIARWKTGTLNRK